MNKINKRRFIIFLATVLIAASGLLATDSKENADSSELDSIFQEGREIFYSGLKLDFAFHPEKYRLLTKNIQKIRDSEKKIPFLYENLINIMYQKEGPAFQALIEKGDETSLRSFRERYFKLCRETAACFVQSLFDEIPETQNLLENSKNVGKTRLDLVLETLDYRNIQKKEKEEFYSVFNRFDFQKQWAFKVAKFKRAHQVTKGEGIKIAIVGTGIDVDNELIQRANMNQEKCYSLIKSKGQPWSQENSSLDEATGHGTAMTSIVSAYAPAAEIFMYKVRDAQNLPYPYWPAMQVSMALYRAVQDKADIIVLSSKFTKDFKFLKEACQFAYEKNVIIVAPNGSHHQANPEKPSHFPAHYNTTIAVSGAIPGPMKKPTLLDKSSVSHYSSVTAPAYLGVSGKGKASDIRNKMAPCHTWATVITGSLVALISSKIPKTGKELNGQYFQRIYEILTSSADPEAVGFKSFHPKAGYGLIDAEKSVGQGLKTYLEKMKKIEERFKKRMEEREKAQKEKEKKEKKK